MPVVKRTLTVCLTMLMLFSLPAVSAYAADEPLIEETVLVDESDVKITATELDLTSTAAELTLALENNTDKNLTFRGTGSNGNAVNSYMVNTGYLNVEISAGKKANETVKFDLDELSIYGITDIGSIEMGFDIIDDDYDDYLQVPPVRLDTSLAETLEEEEDAYQTAIMSLADDSDVTVDYSAQDVLYDVEGVQMLSELILSNPDGDQLMLLEIENTTDEQVYVRLGDFTINGLQVQQGSWTVDCINAGKRRVMDIDLTYMLDNAYSEVFGITDVSDITFSLSLKNAEGDDLAEKQAVQIAVPDVEASFDDSGEVVYDENDIQVISKGLAPDSFEYSDDIHALFLVKNGSSGELDIDCDDDSVSVNGFMTDELCWGSDIPAGTVGILDVELSWDSLEDNGCSSIEDIEELELTLVIRDEKYNTIAEPVVTLQFGSES